MTAFLLGLLGDVLPWLFAAAAALGGAAWLRRDARKDGVREQRTADLERNAKDRRTADEVRQDVAGRPAADIDNRLRGWFRD